VAVPIFFAVCHQAKSMAADSLCALPYKNLMFNFHFIKPEQTTDGKSDSVCNSDRPLFESKDKERAIKIRARGATAVE
jgi:hypothetical protein